MEAAERTAAAVATAAGTWVEGSEPVLVTGPGYGAGSGAGWGAVSGSGVGSGAGSRAGTGAEEGAGSEAGTGPEEDSQAAMGGCEVGYTKGSVTVRIAGRTVTIKEASSDTGNTGRGLHSLTSELNLRTFGTHRSC